MRKSVTLFAFTAFTAFAVLDAEAFNASQWANGTGKVRARAQERTGGRRARRARNIRKLTELGVLVSTNSLAVTATDFAYTSAAAVNERNTASTANFDIEDANDPALPAETQTWLAGLEASLADELGTAPGAKPAPLQFESIDVTKVQVRANHHGASKFRKIVGQEVVNFEGVLVGGADAGLEVKGQYKLNLKANRDFGTAP